MFQTIEQRLLKLAKGAPHLPKTARTTLANNMWWIALVGAVLMLVTLVFQIDALSTITKISNSLLAVVVPQATLMWTTIRIVLVMILIVGVGIALAVAAKPLQKKQKKGWVMLFVALLVSALIVIVNTVLSLNVGSFFMNLILGGLGVLIAGYFIFEVHGEFAHVEKSAGVKQVESTKN